MPDLSGNRIRQVTQTKETQYMRPTSKDLALRDPALAAIMGAVGQPGSDFGGEFGDDSYGTYGYEFGADLGAALGLQGAASGLRNMAGVRQSMQLAPPPAQVQQIVAAAAESHAVTQGRRRMLEPNAGSQVKVERYAFAVNQTLTLGTAVAIDASGQPDTNIRPQRVTINAPSPGFLTISEIKVANVSVTVGGTQDGWDYNALGVGQALDMPTLSPANRARILGNYTGFVPPGFAAAASFTMCASFKGPATIVA